MTLVLLCIAVLVLVTVETGSATKPTASSTQASLPFSAGSHPAPLGSGAQTGRSPYGPGTHGSAARRPTAVAPVNGGDGAGVQITAPVASKTAPPKAPAGSGGDTDNEAATGSDGSLSVGGTGDPLSRSLTMNPFHFRLGLINGAVVKPDARDWAARTVSSGPLLLFLPATGHVPDNYRRFLTVAAQSGYHVLGLDFWNQGKAVANICGVDARCYTQVQRNRFSGEGASQFSKVDEANSVVSRLTAALDYLVVHDPGGGWSQYDHQGVIDWDNIVVAGHSQGGGESAYIAHRFRVMGQLTFSSPIITDQDVRASWLKTRSATPASVMYAFDDVHDEFYPRIVGSWRQLHLSGRLTARVPVPTSSKVHQLVSTYVLGDPGQSHIRSVADNTPLNDKGTPVFEPVWKWMLAQVYKNPSDPAAVAAGS
ncbi:hypothetical protein C8E83_1789 [Frondihabitans australicus]|uniref:Chlorophyllase-like protein n=1 Tax=Frondihabitans australicus TaxID=386892 RepID=A0A495IF82_9MICO|nr:hypothetical protein C8E83_1789 [Frondihabitans australicus]